MAVVSSGPPRGLPTVERDARQELVDWQRRYGQIDELRPALPWVREALEALGQGSGSPPSP